MVVHAVGTVFVVGYTLRRAPQAGDKPDPVTEARLEEERVTERRRRWRKRSRELEVLT
jgi:hypothetical protein